MKMPSKTASETQFEVKKLMIQAAQTEFAAIGAAVKFLARWADSADKFTQSMSEELTRISEENPSSNEIVGRVVDLTRGYLRTLTELSSAAVDDFRNEIEKMLPSQGKRTRAARAKN